MSRDNSSAQTLKRVVRPRIVTQRSGVLALGPVVLGAFVLALAPAAAEARTTITVTMQTGSGDQFLRLAGPRLPGGDRYRVLATIKRIPCRHERFQLGVVATVANPGFSLATSYEATVRVMNVRTLRGRPVSCAPPLRRGLGQRRTTMQIYPAGTRRNDAPIDITGRRTSATGSRFGGIIEAKDRPCQGRHVMRVTLSSGQESVALRLVLRISNVLVNGRPNRCS